MDRYTTLIREAKGSWSESQIANGFAVVKVDAPDAVLEEIAKDPDCVLSDKATCAARISEGFSLPRFDGEKIVYDGRFVPAKPVDELDKVVKDGISHR